MNHASLRAACTSVPGRYAVALFEVAKASDSLDRTLEECMLAAELLTRGKPYRLILLRMLEGKKQQAWQEDFQRVAKFQEFFVRFLQILVSNKRVHYLRDITRMLSMLIDHELKRISLKIYTTQPLEEKDKKSLQSKLASLFDQTLLVSYEIQKNILGGIVVRSNAFTIDISVKHQIEQFSKIAKSYFNGGIHESSSC